MEESARRTFIIEGDDGQTDIRTVILSRAPEGSHGRPRHDTTRHGTAKTNFKFYLRAALPATSHKSGASAVRGSVYRARGAFVRADGDNRSELNASILINSQHSHFVIVIGGRARRIIDSSYSYSTAVAPAPPVT